MNPVMFSIGSIDIRWYSFLILMGILIGYAIGVREARRFNIGDDFMFNATFWTIVMGVIGARLYYVAFNWEMYKNNLLDILKIWNGGLAIHGGIILGGITLIIYCKKCFKETLRIFDIFVPSVLLAQAIGRWGNFFNSEAHGMATNLATLKKGLLPDFVIQGMNIDGIYYQPTFFYESIWCLIGFIILMIIRYRKYTKVGQQTCIYLMWYSLGRFFIEGLRTDSLMLGGFKAAQVLSVILFVVSAFAFMIISRKGKFEDLYNTNKAVKVKYFN